MSARNEQLLQALLSGEALDMEPQSRTEEYLLNLLNGEKPTRAPVSRQDALLAALAEKGLGSGGAAATEPYIEYTMDADGNVTGASFVGFTHIPGYICMTNTEYGQLRTLVTVDFSRSPKLASIGDYAFYDCTGLTLTSLPEGVTSIGDSAFQGCTGLALTSLPEGVTSIGNSAFQDCTGLALTSLPEGVTNIGSYAFRGCTGLALTSLPEGVDHIGAYAFQDCTSLKYMEIAAQKLGTGTRIFQNCTGLLAVWLRNTCTTITAASAANAPFVGCPTSLAIYAEPAAALSGWGAYFNRTGSNGNTTVAVVYGQTERPW